MKYELQQCDNLRFERNANGSKIEGYIKIVTDFLSKHSDIWLCVDGPESQDVKGTRAIRVSDTFSVERFYDEVEEEDFRIIIRDPNTFNDWQIGDNLKVKDTCQEGRVVAVIGKMVAVKWIGEKEIKWFLKSWVDANCELILTDYEKYLKDLQGSSNPNLMRGDKVLVRNSDDQVWEYAVFEKMNEDGEYIANQCSWKQCFSYNKFTWKLMGTNNPLPR